MNRGLRTGASARGHSTHLTAVLAVTQIPSVYTYLLDEVEAVSFGRVDGRLSSEEVARGAVESIRALDRVAYVGAGPRVLFVLFEASAPHYGPADRESIVVANRAMRHPTLRVLVCRSSLQLAAFQVIKMQVDRTGTSRQHVFDSTETAFAFVDEVRPGTSAVLARLESRLREPPVSGVRPHALAAQSSRPAKAALR